MTEKFLTSLGIPPALHTLDLSPVEVKPTDIDRDFEDSRVNLISTMTITKTAIDNLSVLASQSQDPEMYTALASFVRAYTQQQSQLLQLHKLRRDTSSPTPPTNGGTQMIDNRQQTINFTGTPAELAQHLEKDKQK